MNLRNKNALHTWEIDLLQAYEHGSLFPPNKVQTMLRLIKSDINKAKNNSIEKQRSANRKMWQEKTKAGLTYMPWSKATHMLGREVR